MSSSITHTQIVLRTCVSLFRTFAIPLDRKFVIFWNTPSVVIHQTQIVLRSCVSLFCTLAIPFDRKFVIFRDSLSFRIHHTQNVLRSCISLFRTHPIPFGCYFVVSWNTLSLAMHLTQIELGRRVSIRRKRFPFTQGSCVVSRLICGRTLPRNRRMRVFSSCKAITFNRFSTPTHPRTSQKHGKGQAESGSQVSHRGILTENAGNGDSGMDFPVKSLTGHGENSLHRRYETPQMYVSLTLYSDCPISTEKTLQ